MQLMYNNAIIYFGSSKAKYRNPRNIILENNKTLKT